MRYLWYILAVYDMNNAVAVIMCNNKHVDHLKSWRIGLQPPGGIAIWLECGHGAKISRMFENCAFDLGAHMLGLWYTMDVVPRKPRSAYFLFANDARSQIKTENPGERAEQV